MPTYRCPHLLRGYGLLFFGRDPQRFLPRAEVKLARFQGTTTLAFIDRLIVHGTLPEMLDGAERFIRRNTRTAMKVVEFESVQVTEYPYDAVREALVNAMAHRDYHHSSGIQVNIFDDRLEVMSPGEALIPLSELEGSHVTRNETLCRRFRDIGEMEQFGTGITKMKRLMREHGLKEPIFGERGSFFKVTFCGPGDRILDLIPHAGATDLRTLGLNERQIGALRLMVNDREFQVTQERIVHFQRWLVDLRRTARPEEFEAVSSGYRLEIERMQAEALEYLLRPVAVEERVAVGIAASGLDIRSQIAHPPERFSQTAFVGSN